VVERTIGWLKGLRRPRIRDDRSAVMQDAWDTLAACVMCFRPLHDDDSRSEEVLAEPLKTLSRSGKGLKTIP
jgi:hypothetical protein